MSALVNSQGGMEAVSPQPGHLSMDSNMVPGTTLPQFPNSFLHFGKTGIVMYCVFCDGKHILGYHC